MNMFQIIGATVTALLLVATITALVRHQVAFRTAVGWMIVWIAAAVTIIHPAITVTIARALGIGRGADLVFYCGILAMLAGFFILFVRMRRMEHELTRLVRRVAIDETMRQQSSTPETASRE